jgi:parkin
MSFFVRFIRVFLDKMLELFSFGRKKISNKLPIFIRTNTGQSLSLNLDPEWNISNVKQLVAPQLGLMANEVSYLLISRLTD